MANERLGGGFFHAIPTPGRFVVVVVVSLSLSLGPRPGGPTRAQAQTRGPTGAQTRGAHGLD
jgi:hypothetical protein